MSTHTTTNGRRELTEAEIRAHLQAADALDAAAAAIPVTACPDWCNLAFPHPWESEDGLTLDKLHRIHEHQVGGLNGRATVCVTERRDTNGAVSHDPAFVLLTAGATAGGDDLTVSAAYDLGDDLNTAAALAERINARAGIVTAPTGTAVTVATTHR